MSAPDRRRLAVFVDGVPLPDEEARALWERFSAFMEEHRGDLAGFAASEGFKSVHPTVENGRPVLRASHSEGQRPYASAPTSGGSDALPDQRRPDRSRN